MIFSFQKVAIIILCFVAAVNANSYGYKIPKYPSVQTNNNLNLQFYLFLKIKIKFCNL